MTCCKFMPSGFFGGKQNLQKYSLKRGSFRTILAMEPEETRRKGSTKVLDMHLDARAHQMFMLNRKGTSMLRPPEVKGQERVIHLFEV